MDHGAWTSRFELVRCLGSGGGGVVYEAIDRTTHKRLALKTFRCRDANAAASVKAEFRALHRLRHPNLVGVGELLQHDDEWCFTMELVDGVDFTRWFDGVREHELAIDKLQQMTCQLVHAVSALHDEGMIHLDIKPGNVLVTERGQLILIDVGVAASNGIDDRGRLIGTMPYTAPERLTGGHVGPATDWYSLGVVLYEVVAGRRPFPGTGLDEHLRAQLAGPDREPLAAAPSTLVDLICDLLAYDPAMRPSRDDILVRLGELSSGTPEHVGALGSTAHRRAASPDALATLTALARRSVGKRTIVAMAGGPGSGKTATLDALCRELGTSEGLVVRVETSSSEAVAFRGLVDLIDALVQHVRRVPFADQVAVLPAGIDQLARLFPVVERIEVVRTMCSKAPVTLDHLHATAATVIGRWIAALAARQHVTLAIDDLQRWDLDALGLWERVVAHLPDTNLLVVGCRRDGRTFGTEDTTIEMTAPPLDHLHVENLREHVEQLPPPVRRIVDVLLASTVPLPVPVLIAIAGSRRDEGRAAIRRLVRHGIALACSTMVCASEDVRSLAYRLSPSAIVEWRRAIAASLEEADAPLELRALAYRAAGANDKAIDHARRAATTAFERGAFERAADLWTLAIEAGDDSVSTALACSDALRLAGHGRRAAKQLLAIADRDPERAVAHRRAAGLLLLRTGDVDDGLALLHDTDRIGLPRSTAGIVGALVWGRVRLGRLRFQPRAEVDPATTLRIDLLWAIAGALGLVDSMRGALVQTRCSQLALASGDAARASRALASEAAFRAVNLGPREPIDSVLRDAEALANQADDPHARAWLDAGRAFVSLLYGEWRPTVQHGRAADAALASLEGTHWERAALSHALVSGAYFTGDLATLDRITRDQQIEARRQGDSFAHAVAQTASIAILLAQDRLGEAASEIEAARQAWPRVTHVQSSFVTLQHANVSIAIGEPERAYDLVIAGIREMRRALLLKIPLVRVPLREAAARAAIASARRTDGGARRKWIARARTQLAELEREPLEWARALAELLHGGIVAVVDGETAARAIRACAAIRLDALDMPMHAAFARTRAGLDPGWTPPIEIPRWSAFATLHAP